MYTPIVAYQRSLKFNGYLLFCSVLLFSSSASFIAKSDIALVLVATFGLVLNIFENRYKIYLINLFKITSIFFIILAIYYIKNGSLDIYTWCGLLAKLILAYNAIFYCNKDFEIYCIKSVYILSTISLILYVFQLLDFNLLFKINNLFGLGANRGLEPNSNSLFFTLAQGHKIRNCGFMWEPGAYAAVLIFVLLLSFKNNPKIDNIKLIIIICILTTFSTTGYISLLIILAYFFYYKLKAYTLVFIIPIFLLFMNINFINDKIINQLNSIEDDLSITQYSNEYTIHLNRFASMYADYNTFINNPIIGLGLDIGSTGKKEFYKEYDENVVRTSGIMFTLIKSGIMGLAVYTFLIFRRLSLRYADKRFALLYCIIVLIELISNPLEFSTILLSFLFL